MFEPNCRKSTIRCSKRSEAAYSVVRDEIGNTLRGLPLITSQERIYRFVHINGVDYRQHQNMEEHKWINRSR